MSMSFVRCASAVSRFWSLWLSMLMISCCSVCLVDNWRVVSGVFFFLSRVGGGGLYSGLGGSDFFGVYFFSSGLSDLPEKDFLWLGGVLALVSCFRENFWDVCIG